MSFRVRVLQPLIVLVELVPVEFDVLVLVVRGHEQRVQVVAVELEVELEVLVLVERWREQRVEVVLEVLVLVVRGREQRVQVPVELEVERAALKEYHRRSRWLLRRCLEPLLGTMSAVWVS